FEIPLQNSYMMFTGIVRDGSALPAITHIDGTARLQSVDEKENPDFHELLKAFEERTGCGVLINTSFNIRGEPIVCSPSDAYQCFMKTKMDVLVLENCLLWKQDQPKWNDSGIVY